MFTNKTYRLFIAISALFFTFFLNATKKVVPCEEDSETKLELLDIIGHIGTFLKERELFILARWHKNSEERNIILEASGNSEKLRFYKEIKRHEKNRKELRRKEAFLYPNFAFRTCLCGTEMFIKIPVWTTLACTNFAFQAVKSVCILSSMFIVECVSYPCESSGEEAAACGEWCSKILCYSDSNGEFCPSYLNHPRWKIRLSCDSLRQDKIDIKWLKSQRMERLNK